jgi:hypothetical protein
MILLAVDDHRYWTEVGYGLEMAAGASDAKMLHVSTLSKDLGRTVMALPKENDPVSPITPSIMARRPRPSSNPSSLVVHKSICLSRTTGKRFSLIERTAVLVIILALIAVVVFNLRRF